MKDFLAEPLPFGRSYPREATPREILKGSREKRSQIHHRRKASSWPRHGSVFFSRLIRFDSISRTKSNRIIFHPALPGRTQPTREGGTYQAPISRFRAHADVIAFCGVSFPPFPPISPVLSCFVYPSPRHCLSAALPLQTLVADRPTKRTLFNESQAATFNFVVVWSNSESKKGAAERAWRLGLCLARRR
jgi:hypothetical protein